MKYYRITNGSESTEFCELRIPENNTWFNEQRLYANKWENRSLLLPIPMNVNNKYEPDDYPIASTKLVSKKVVDCIKTVNKDYEALSTQIFYNGEKIYNLYYTMLFPEYSVFNYNKSDFKPARADPKKIMILRTLVLDKEKVAQLPSDNNIFCMQELRTKIICTEIAKDALEKAGVIGMKFEELDIR